MCSNSCTCDIDAMCYHHGEHDETPFKNFLGKGESYSNAEFYDFIHPWNDDLPYIFDTYSFDYCETYDNLNFLEGMRVNKLEFTGYK